MGNIATEVDAYSNKTQEVISCDCLFGEFLSYQDSNTAYICEVCARDSYSLASYDK